MVARAALSLVEEHSISLCLSTNAFRLVYRICSLVCSFRRCALPVLLTERQTPHPKLKTYQALSWLNLAALLGMIASLPFAPPWDGETRIFAATLPLFFLLPASGVGGLYLLIVKRFQETNPTRKQTPSRKLLLAQHWS